MMDKYRALKGRKINVYRCNIMWRLLTGVPREEESEFTEVKDYPIFTFGNLERLLRDMTKAIAEDYERDEWYEVRDAETGETLIKVYLGDLYSIEVEWYV